MLWQVMNEIHMINGSKITKSYYTIANTLCSNCDEEIFQNITSITNITLHVHTLKKYFAKKKYCLVEFVIQGNKLLQIKNIFCYKFIIFLSYWKNQEWELNCLAPKYLIRKLSLPRRFTHYYNTFYHLEECNLVILLSFFLLLKFLSITCNF